MEETQVKSVFHSIYVVFKVYVLLSYINGYLVFSIEGSMSKTAIVVLFCIFEFDLV